MGTRGPKRVPKSLRVLRGNPSKTRLTDDVPGIGDLFVPPRYMNAEQRRVWDSVIARAPWLTGSDAEIVELFVNASVEYRRAVLEVRRSGQVVETKNGNVIPNPYLGVQNRQAGLMHRFGAELGLSPTSRASLGASIDSSMRRANGQESLRDYLDERPTFDNKEMN
jgi:P27 family predicted phage terminase small subunit